MPTPSLSDGAVDVADPAWPCKSVARTFWHSFCMHSQAYWVSFLTYEPGSPVTLAITCIDPAVSFISYTAHDLVGYALVHSF